MKVIVLDEGMMKKAKVNLYGGKPQVDPDGNTEMCCAVGDTEIYLTYDETSRFPWVVVILIEGDASIDDSGDMHTYELSTEFEEYEYALDFANEVAKKIKPKDTPWDIQLKFKRLNINKLY